MRVSIMRVSLTIPNKVLSCKLWNGSELQLANEYRSLTLQDVRKKILKMEKLDDRTPAETEYMEVLQSWVTDLGQCPCDREKTVDPSCCSAGMCVRAEFFE